MKILYFFLFLWVIFALLDPSGSAIWMRMLIRIQQLKSGYGSESSTLYSGSQINADPDPSQTLPSQKLEFWPFSCLWTCDLYDPVCNAFDAGNIHKRGQVGRGWALDIETFLGPVKWHWAVRRVPFGAQKSRVFLTCFVLCILASTGSDFISDFDHSDWEWRPTSSMMNWWELPRLHETRIWFRWVSLSVNTHMDGDRSDHTQLKEGCGQCSGSGYVSFGPPGAGPINPRYGSGSGFFNHQPKIVRKNFIFTVLRLLNAFYLWRMM